MVELVFLILENVLEAVYFSLFLIIGKKIKNKKLLFVSIMFFQYLLLKQLIRYNVLFHLIYTFVSFVDLKFLYNRKAQITDIFLFAGASIILIILSILSYFIIYFTLKEYVIALILNRILMFLFLFVFRNKISDLYYKFCSLWNRHNRSDKIRSLTLRNISIIVFNLMFFVINFCTIIAIKYLN